eukprot:CAMPEP_0174851258 /NCGR_PEP_ID=MMETSP1114-20130205/22546_1 /TAXON_ID=312471 /ORGANISM="Neobodo designis, Strain CCAP 1951/1" /LENGTH=61 /DNA_ID=CAMNT_0016085781 /DNA_START=27 /DNA_END=208 /DNA_ORIENTATION=+
MPKKPATPPVKKDLAETAPATRPKRGRPASGAQTFPEELTCCICYDVLNDAHQAPCCGQLA